MTDPHHIAGRSTREMAARRGRLSGLVLGLAITICLALLVGLTLLRIAPGIGAPIFVGLAIVGVRLIWSLATFSGQLDRAKARAERGAVAEEHVGALLDSLGPDFVSLHDLPCAYGNIDHLVIGAKCGLVLIETKSHRGHVTARGDSLLVNGRRPEKSYTRQALRNTVWLRDQIEGIVGFRAWVTPLLLFTNATIGVQRPVERVWVTHVRDLVSFLATGRGDPARAAEVWQARDAIRERLAPPPPPTESDVVIFHG